MNSTHDQSVEAGPVTGAAIGMPGVAVVGVVDGIATVVDLRCPVDANQFRLVYGSILGPACVG